MAIELVVEVLDHAPADLTPGEALVLVAIAEAIRRPGEPRGIEHVDMLRRTRMTPRGLRDAITRLAHRGIDVRVRLGTGKDGRPFYTVPGKSPTYRLPTFKPPAGCSCPACQAGRALPKAAPQRPLDGTKAAPQRRQAAPQRLVGGVTAPPGGTTAPPSPSVEEPSVDARAHAREAAPDPERTPAQRIVLTRTDATPDLLPYVIDYYARLAKGPVERYIDRVPAADLQQQVDRVRNKRDRRELKQWRERAQQQTDCPHGTPGGDLPRPTDGLPDCPLCRAIVQRQMKRDRSA